MRRLLRRRNPFPRRKDETMIRTSRRRRKPTFAERFDAWLTAACTAAPAERTRLLTNWQQAPAARASHPREEHLLPL
ncbi:MAG TPA: hypothetical protein PKM48_11095, partial [Parvularculaceae bacterium]|nr:hypothetical protein [Parvularculaceae bacterium]